MNSCILMNSLPDYFNTIIAVITYNPDLKFKDRVKRYVEIADKTIIVDNGSVEDISQYIPKELNEHFIVVKSPQNKGIAWGLNQGALYAKKHGFPYLLTFDQDSLPIQEILNCYANVLRCISGVGLVGTSFTEKEVMMPSYVTYRSQKTLITSGTLHRVSIFDEVGLYDEQLFIDSVDFDFVLRVKKKFHVLRVNEALIHHELGTPIVKYGISSSNHNAIRRYYMSRNHVLICRRYWKDYPVWVVKKTLLFFGSILKMMMIEDGLKEKTFNTIRGLKDAFKLK